MRISKTIIKIEKLKALSDIQDKTGVINLKDVSLKVDLNSPKYCCILNAVPHGSTALTAPEKINQTPAKYWRKDKKCLGCIRQVKAVNTAATAAKLRIKVKRSIFIFLQLKVKDVIPVYYKILANITFV